jgi:hypothetical protein
MMAKIWNLLTDKDWKTWVGHFVAGFALTWLWGWQVAFGAFIYREGDNLWEWWRDPRPQGADYKTNSEVKRPRDEKLFDGFMDYLSAMVGAAVAELVKTL